MSRYSNLTRLRPSSHPPASAPPVIAPTGSPGVDAVADVINKSVAPFQNAPPPEQGTAGAVAHYAGGALALVGAPAELIDTAFATLTAPIAALFPSLPAVTLLGMHVGLPHTHTHPPSLIPPAPPVPLPSIGMLLASGSVAVLVGGMPAARAGDIGVSVTCGSLAPPFEVVTGSSNVFIGGSRAARVGDITRHCNPMPMSAFGAAMGAAGAVVGALGAAGEAAAGNSAAAAAKAAQAAADAAKMALQLLCGKDPGLPPGVGALLGPPVPNVLIGGFPCPNVGDFAVAGLLKGLKKLARAAKGKFSSRRGNRPCGTASHPIYLITGETYDSFTDFVSTGLLEWKRHYTTARHRRDSALGFCNRHHYERSFLVRLNRAVFTDWDGEEIEFPRFEKGSNTTKSNGYVLERLEPGRYVITIRGQPAMEFTGGEFEGELSLRTVFDENRELELVYDDQGRVSAFIDKNHSDRSRVFYELQYDRDGHIEELLEVPLTGQPILRAAYGYDNKGNLTGAQDALGSRWRYEYDWRHCLTKATDPNGYSYTWRYDASGRCVWTSGQDGLWWAEFDYHPEERFTAYRQGENARWKVHYDDDGFVVKIVDPYGGIKTRERDEEGKLVREIDSGGRVMEWLYDADGAHYGRRDHYGFIYPPEYEQPQLPDPFEKTFPETPLGRLCGGTIVPSEEAAFGVPVGETGIKGSPLLDSLPRELKGPAHETFTLSKRSLGNIAKLKVREEQDALGHKVEEEDSLGRRQTWRYDASGNEIEHIDRDGKVHRKVTASWNLVGEKYDPLGHAMKYSHDKLENITVVVDPLGSVSRYDYDLKERLIRVRRHGRVREEYLYDQGDHFIEKRDGEGRTIFTNEYHENHRVALRKLASGGFQLFDYDEFGQPTKASTDKHEVVLKQDLLGRRVLDQRDGLGLDRHYRGGSDAEVTTRLFSRFLQSRERRPDGTSTLEEPTGKRTLLRTEDTGLVKRHCSNGTLELSQYDHEGLLLGRLAYKRASDGSLQYWTVRYRYSAEGDLLRVADSARGTTRYEVDDAHRLVGEVRPDGQRLSYEIDASGNILGKPGLSRVYLDSGNRLRATKDELFDYDGRNHLVRRRSRDGSETCYFFDSFDLLSRVERTDATGNPEPPVELEHDGLGRLSVLRCGGLKREFYWDGDRLAAEIQPNGSVRIFNYGGDDALVPLNFTEYASLDSAPEIGKTYTVFSDQVGMPLQIEDDQGGIVWWASRVEPYGMIDVHPSSQIEYNLRWPGHYFDPVTGLHYNRRRTYDPALGRYLQSDPIGYKGSEVNLYGYCRNPLVQVDVLGLADKCGGGKQNTDGTQDSADDNNTGSPPKQWHEGQANGRTAKKLSQERAKQYRNNEDVNTVTAIVDTETGRVYYGKNGDRPRGSELNSTLADRRNQILRDTNGQGYEDWSVDNCAEYSAYNKALQDGANPANLEMHTVNTRNGSPKERCDNCKVTTQDVGRVTSDPLDFNSLY